MTLYTYRCPNCGEFQEFREANDRILCNCGLIVKKIFGGAFALHGNGYYSNDVRRDEAINVQ